MNRLYTGDEINIIQEFANTFKKEETVGNIYFEKGINDEKLLLFGEQLEGLISYSKGHHVKIKSLANDLLEDNLDSVVLSSLRYLTTTYDTIGSSFTTQYKISNTVTGKKYAFDIVFNRVDSPLGTGEFAVIAVASVAIEGTIGDRIGWNGNLLDSFSGFNDVGFGYILDEDHRSYNVYLSNSAKKLLGYFVEGNFISLTTFTEFIAGNAHISTQKMMADIINLYDNRDSELRHKFSAIKKSGLKFMDILIKRATNIELEEHKVLSMTIIDNTHLHQKASEAKDVFKFFKGGVITWYPQIDPTTFRVSKITSFVFDEIVDYDTYTISYDNLVGAAAVGVIDIEESSIEHELAKLKKGVVNQTYLKFEYKKGNDITVLRANASVTERDYANNPAKIVITFFDMTEERKLSDELSRTYKIDPLTSIYNRASYYEDCLGTEGTLLCIDLDDFKDVNDTYGHVVGDEYLMETAELLKVFADKHNGSAYRIGGDEFVIRIPEEHNIEEQKILCEELIELRIFTNKYGGVQYDLSFTIGSASTKSDSITPDSLYEIADRALYNAKKVSKGSYSVASEKNARQYNDQKEIDKLINKALKYSEFYPKYVPRFDLQGKVVGIEVDATWKDKSGRELSSYEFMSNMYRMNAVHALDTMILKKAFEELKTAIAELSLDSREFSVTAYACKSTVLSNDLKKLITQHSTINNNLSAYLEIDIPDITISLNTIKVVSEVNKVAKLRAAISLQAMEETDTEDIFNYLEIVKPNSLIYNARANNRPSVNDNEQVLSSIGKIARDLKIDFYVIGIDNEDEMDYYKKLDFTVFQGNYCSSSLTIDEVIELIKKQKNS